MLKKDKIRFLCIVDLLCYRSAVVSIIFHFLRFWKHTVKVVAVLKNYYYRCLDFGFCTFYGCSYPVFIVNHRLRKSLLAVMFCRTAVAFQ